MRILNGIIECFEEYSTTGCIPVGKIYVYGILHKRALFPLHTKRFKEQIKRKANRKRYKARENSNTDRKSLKSILLQIQSKQNIQTVLCKEIILETYFRKLIAQGKLSVMSFNVKVLGLLLNGHQTLFNGKSTVIPTMTIQR